MDNPRIKNEFCQQEIPLLYEMEKECFKPPFRWSKTEFTSQLNRNNVWIIEDEFVENIITPRSFGSIQTTQRLNRIVGFLIAKVFRGKACILTVEVPENYRGRGYATRLITACEQYYEMRGIKTLRLEVYTENPAQLMYFKLGYRITGFEKDWYDKGKSAVIMTKTL
jgi:ribosomal protein S18 acetylase RimI-like enzyme